MRGSLWFAAFSSVFVLGACVADPPDIASSVSADAGSNAADGGADDSNDSGSGSAKNDDGGPGSDFGDDEAGAPSESDVLSSSCADIDGGGATCGGAAPVCCAVQKPGGGFNSVSFECATSNASCAAATVGVAITCRQPEDCPSGSVCCGRKSSTDSSVFVSVKCESSCEGVASFGHAQYCDPSDPHTCDGTNSGTTPNCVPSDFPGMFDCESE